MIDLRNIYTFVFTAWSPRRLIALKRTCPPLSTAGRLFGVVEMKSIDKMCAYRDSVKRSEPRAKERARSRWLDPFHW